MAPEGSKEGKDKKVGNSKSGKQNAHWIMFN